MTIYAFADKNLEISIYYKIKVNFEIHLSLDFDLRALLQSVFENKCTNCIITVVENCVKASSTLIILKSDK